MQTGLPGSVRTPRILGATRISIPAAQSSPISPSRFVNEHTGPFFVRDLVFLASASSAGANLAQIRLRMTAGKTKCTTNYIPFSAFADGLSPVFGATGGGGCRPGIWRFKKPFIVPAGRSVLIEIQNDNAAAINFGAALLGHFESMPAKFTHTYVPGLLSDSQILAATTGTAVLSDEALRNHGAYPFITEALTFVGFNTSSYTTLVTQNSLTLKLISSAEPNLTINPANQAAFTQLFYASSVPSSVPTPVPETIIQPAGGFSGELANTSANEVRADVGVRGYYEVPLSDW